MLKDAVLEYILKNLFSLKKLQLFQFKASSISLK